MKVLFFTLGDPTVASSRTRVFQYLPHLKSRGVDVQVIQHKTGLDYRLLAWSADKPVPQLMVTLGLKAVALFHVLYSTVQVIRLFLKASFFDVVFIQKALLPIALQKRLRKLNPRIVFDYDDALYADEKSYSKSRLETQMTHCKLVVIENEFTEQYAKDFKIPYLRITGPMDCARYQALDPESGAKTDEVIVGWIGSRSTTQFLELIGGPLREASAKFPHLVLEVIGAGALELPGVRIRRFPWTLESEVDLLRRFHIGIMPLVDNEFTRGKGGYKLLQYMAMRIPSIASPVGINREILIEGQTGFLCGNDAEWLKAIEQLVGDAGLRKTMGQQARNDVVKRFSYEISTPKLLEGLETVAKGQP